MRSLRVTIDLAFALPDGGEEMDATKAFAELPAAVKTRALALRNAIRDCWVDARQLGVMERPRAVMHVCLHGPDGSGACGPETEIR